jgi:heat shock protein HslJ
MKKNLTILFLMTILLAACAGTNPLSDTTWELVSYGAIDNQIPALPDVDATISFDADGEVSGNVGCNDFGGSAKIDGDKIVAGPLMATEMYCERGMEQEMAVLMLLYGDLAFEIDGDTLTIFSEDGSMALYFLRTKN